MGYCPFLSYKINTVTRNSSTFSGTVYKQDGSIVAIPPVWNPSLPEELIYVPSQVTPDGDDTINYSVGLGGAGQFDANGFFICPQSTACQIWDSINLRCGMRNSDYIYNSSVAESNAVVNLIKAIIGDYVDRDTGDLSLMTWAKGVLGSVNDRDTGNLSLVAWAKEVLGSVDDRDTGNLSIVSWLQDVLGSVDDRDTGNISLLTWAKDVLGSVDDRDTGNISIMTWLQNVLGSVDDRDTGNLSIISWLKSALGSVDDRDTGNLTVISWLKEIVGSVSDQDTGNLSLVSWSKEVLGSVNDRDTGGLSFVEWAKTIIGSVNNLDLVTLHQIGDMLKTWSHIHNLHYHASDPGHIHPGGGSGVMEAMILIAEFMNKKDMDNGKGPGSSIFGTDFMITKATAPPALLAIYEHPEWSDPIQSMTWSDYLAL